MLKPFPVLTSNYFSQHDYTDLGIQYLNEGYVYTGKNRGCTTFDLTKPIKDLTVIIYWKERLESDKLEGNIFDSQYSCTVFYKSETNRVYDRVYVRRLADSLGRIVELANITIKEIYQELETREKRQKEIEKYLKINKLNPYFFT